MKLGAEYRVYRKNEYNPYPASTVGSAGGSSTRLVTVCRRLDQGPTDTSSAPPIGAGLASFLLGQPTGGGIARRASFAEQFLDLGRLSSGRLEALRRLTFSFGLRYELEGPLTERLQPQRAGL